MPKVRVAPSIGELERTFEEAWGLETYNPETDKDEPTVFVGLYGLDDFYQLWRHKGKKWLWWAGSDIRHLRDGYWLDEKGKIKLISHPLAKWIQNNCESWVENGVEYDDLRKLGIKSQICPSFLGDVNDYKVEYKYNEVTKLYASVSGDDFELYKWHEIEKLAAKYPQIEFHLYGNTKEWKAKNTIVHGRVPKEQMNEEIKTMQGGLRLLEFDGFSEVIAKSVLWGQWPVSAIEYPHTLKVSEIGLLKKEPNLKGREYYLEKLNKYTWVK